METKKGPGRYARKNKTSRYWGVSLITKQTGSSAEMKWSADHPWRCYVALPGGVSISKYHPTEREAAIHADIINLEHRLGRPLNVLKPKGIH